MLLAKVVIKQHFPLRHKNPHSRALCLQAVKIVQNQKRYWRAQNAQAA